MVEKLSVGVTMRLERGDSNAAAALVLVLVVVTAVVAVVVVVDVDVGSASIGAIAAAAAERFGSRGRLRIIERRPREQRVKTTILVSVAMLFVVNYRFDERPVDGVASVSVEPITQAPTILIAEQTTNVTIPATNAPSLAPNRPMIKSLALDRPAF